MFDFLDDLWNWLSPPLSTPEEKIASAQERLRQQENSLLKEGWMIQARMESHDKRAIAVAKKRSEDEIRQCARERLHLEKSRSSLQRRMNELQETKDNVSQMRIDQVKTSVLVDVMSATNDITMDPVVARETLQRYQYLATQRESVTDIMRDAMKEREEEAELSEETEMDRKRLEEFVRETMDLSNQFMLEQMPPVNVNSLSPTCLENMSKAELTQRNVEQMGKLDLFLSQRK